MGTLIVYSDPHAPTCAKYVGTSYDMQTLTYYSKVDFGISGLRSPEVDAAPVHARVRVFDMVNAQLCRLLLWHKVRPIREHGFVGPPIC